MPQPNLKDSALVRMLSKLDRKQLKGFRFYLECPLFNTNKTLEELFSFLERKVLMSSKEVIPESTLLKVMQVSSPQADKLFSKLLYLLNRYLFIYRNQENEVAEYPEIYRSWIEMDLDQDLMEREFKKMSRKMEGPIGSEIEIFHQLRLEHYNAGYRVQQPRKDQADNFTAGHDLLDQFYWVSKLKYQCAALNMGRIFSKAEVNSSIDLIPTQVETLPALGKAYWSILTLFKAEDFTLSDARPMFQMLEEGPTFSLEDNQDLYGYLLNLTIRKVGKALSFEKLLLEVYDAMLAKGLLTSHGKISGGHFKNIVSIKSRQGQMGEAEQFVNQYQDFLPATDVDPLIPYCRGLLLFYRQDYLVAMRHFRSLLPQSTEDMFWALEIRSMLWKSYFEGFQKLGLEEHEEMLKLYHSFRIFVSRNTLLSDYHKSCYENFIRIFNRLIKVGEQSTWAVSKSELIALRDSVASIEELAHRRWILEAIQKKVDRL